MGSCFWTPVDAWAVGSTGPCRYSLSATCTPEVKGTYTPGPGGAEQ